MELVEGEDVERGMALDAGPRLIWEIKAGFVVQKEKFGEPE